MIPRHLSWTRLCAQRFAVSIPNIHATRKSSTLSSSLLANEKPLANLESNGHRKLVATFQKYEQRCQMFEMVNYRDFERTFRYTKTMIRTNDPLPVFGTILLRSCGRLMVNKHHKDREKYVRDVWSYLKSQDVSLDITHYNTLLEVMNENNTIYNAEDKLKEIEEANLKPNSVTYRRIIHQYCLQGNVEAATRYLELMKGSGHKLTESIFASLFIGYLKQDDPPPIHEIFDLMTTNNIKPGAMTYVSAISTLAQLVDKKPELIHTISEIFAVIDKERIELSTFDISSIFISVSNLKKKPRIDNFLRNSYDSMKRNPSLYYIISATLCVNGHYQQCSKLYWHLKLESRMRDTVSDVIYLKSLCHSISVPKQFIVKECDKILSANYQKKDPFYDLYHKACSYGRVDVAEICLERLAANGLQMAPEYYLPFFVQARTQEDLEKASKYLEPFNISIGELNLLIGWKHRDKFHVD